MTNSSELPYNLLVNNDSFIKLYQELAVLIGLNEAIVVQAIHNWNLTNKRTKTGHETHFFDGRWWVYNTWAEWRETDFPFWCDRTIKRIFDNLENPDPEKSKFKVPLIISKPHENQQKGHWFALDYDALEALIAAANPVEEELEPEEGEGPEEDDSEEPEEVSTPDNLSSLPLTTCHPSPDNLSPLQASHKNNQKNTSEKDVPQQSYGISDGGKREFFSKLLKAKEDSDKPIEETPPTPLESFISAQGSGSHKRKIGTTLKELLDAPFEARNKKGFPVKKFRSPNEMYQPGSAYQQFVTDFCLQYHYEKTGGKFNRKYFISTIRHGATYVNWLSRNGFVEARDLKPQVTPAQEIVEDTIYKLSELPWGERNLRISDAEEGIFYDYIEYDLEDVPRPPQAGGDEAQEKEIEAQEEA